MTRNRSSLDDQDLGNVQVTTNFLKLGGTGFSPASPGHVHVPAPQPPISPAANYYYTGSERPARLRFRFNDFHAKAAKPSLGTSPARRPIKMTEEGTRRAEEHGARQCLGHGLALLPTTGVGRGWSLLAVLGLEALGPRQHLLADLPKTRQGRRGVAEARRAAQPTRAAGRRQGGGRAAAGRRRDAGGAGAGSEPFRGGRWLYPRWPQTPCLPAIFAGGLSHDRLVTISCNWGQ